MVKIILSDEDTYEGKRFIYIKFETEAYHKKNKRFSIGLGFKDLENLTFADIPSILREHADSFEKLNTHKTI